MQQHLTWVLHIKFYGIYTHTQRLWRVTDESATNRDYGQSLMSRQLTALKEVNDAVTARPQAGGPRNVPVGKTCHKMATH